MDSSFNWIQSRLAEVLELDPKGVTREMRFGTDLDADSIDLIEVVNGAEREFGIIVEEQDLYDLETVGEVVDLIDRLRSS